MIDQHKVASRGDDMLNGLRAVRGGVWRTYLAPKAKVVFVSLNKNACTSLKWMMADLAGEDLSSFRAGADHYVDDSSSIHDRQRWKVSPKLNRLPPELRAQIHPDNGWFVFAVVRDPRLRLFSAWQNRLLVEATHPGCSGESWYPRHPLTADTVVEDFAKFVAVLDREGSHPVRTNDPHFRDQVELLAEDVVPYSRIYEISEMQQLHQDLTTHLSTYGLALPPSPRRDNTTPLRPVGALYANGVREQIERIYAADFDRFGHLWDFARIDAAAPWSDDALQSCEQQAALVARIKELHRAARVRGEKLAVARDDLAQAESRIAVLEAQLSSPTHGLGARARRFRLTRPT